MSDGNKVILSVGQCSFDHGNISQAIRKKFGATVEASATRIDALQWLKSNQADLVLVNRLFDEDGDSGIDFLKVLRASHPTVPVMLVSNLPEAHQQARSAGGAPGFGKAELGTARMTEALQPFLG